MNDAKKTVKQALSFVLVVVLIVAALFGLDVPYGIEEVAPETEELTAELVVTDEASDKESTQAVLSPTDEADTPTDEVAPPAEDSGETADEVENHPPQETAPTEDETVEDAAPSETVEVADPSEVDPPATEGDVENA